MLIQPGADGPSVHDFIEMIRVDSKRRVDVTMLDSEGVPVIISELMLPNGEPDGELSLTIENMSGTTVFEEVYWPNPSPASRRIKHNGAGRYYVTLGDEENETSSLGMYTASWHARQNSTSEDEYRVQVLSVVSVKSLTLLPKLRLFLDKSLKIVDPASNCYLGFSDSQLMVFLLGGLSYISDFEPYPMWLTLDAFPTDYHSDLLIKSAAYSALQSQTLFAIDSDVAQFSTASHTFTINHFQPLAAFTAQLRAEIEPRIKQMKMKYLASGTCKVQLNIGYAMHSLLSAAPYGSTFRGMYTVY